MYFKNKTVLITGGSRGIGKATAIAFSQKGARVAINYRSDNQAAKETLAQLEGKGHIALKYDIAAEDEPKKLIDDFIRHYDQLDILVNNAGIATLHEVDNVNFNTWKDSWKQIIDTNLIATANMCYWAAQHMMKNGGGRIINVSSRGAFRGEPDMPAYGASKAGVNALSQSLAKALAKHNIFIGVVAPGFTDTAMATATLTETQRKQLLDESPFKRMAKPEEVAYSILFLASEGAEYTSGAILDINGASYLRT